MPIHFYLAFCALIILLAGTLYVSAAGDYIGAYSCILENNEYTGFGEITSFDVDENGKILVNILYNTRRKYGVELQCDAERIKTSL